jgi:allantoinase
VAYDLVLKSARVALPDGVRSAAICITGNRIAAIEPFDAIPGTDLGELALLPGLVDTHVHINEPGRADWEGFATASAAASAGGVTTLIDMPLNSIPATTTVQALQAKRRAADGHCDVDVGFWGGAVPQNLDTLPDLYAAGVFGFKAFLSPSGVPEFDSLTLEQLKQAFSTVDATFLVHAEDPNLLREAPASCRYADFLASRPAAAEQSAIGHVIAAARDTGARVHILHLSAAGALPAIASARRDGVRITVETCPHYLTLAAERIPDGATAYKCCPPIRNAANADLLWAALGEGVIDFIASDHSPSPPELKAGNFATAWGGISSLQIGLPVIWTQASRRGHTLTDVAGWMATRPAQAMGVAGKGRIAVGYDADLVAFAPGEMWQVDPHALHHRHPVTPYAGHTLAGVVHQVWLRGEPIGQSRGRLITRTARTAAM